MGSSVAEIGRCKGCGKPSRLDDGCCQGCLSHPKRGRQWCETSQRIRTDPAFALEAFNLIGANNPERELPGKLLFIRMYGLPKGGICPPELRAVIGQFYDGPEPEPEPAPILRLVR